MKPLETAPIFLKPRLRLLRQVPVVETLEFVKKFKDDDSFHPHIKYFVANMTEGVNSFFEEDIRQLGSLKWQLETGEYKLTVRGRMLLGNRLRSTYIDGLEYQIAADMLREIEIKPILDLEPTILKSKRTAFGAKNLSKQIGQETGIEISASNP